MIKKFFNIKIISVMVCVTLLAVSFALFSVSADEKPILKGDVNGDGSLDVCDCVKIINHVDGVSILTGAALERADVNSDGEVNRNDAVRLARYIGLDVDTLDDNYETPIIVV